MSTFWFRSRLSAIAVYGDTTPATLASILSSALWLVCLVFPGTLIGPPGVGRPTYRYMYEVADEPTWCLIFGSVFLLQLWRMFCQEQYSEHRKSIFVLEVAIKTWAAMVWTFIALACMIAQYTPAAAMSDAIVIAGLCWWDMLRCESQPSQCVSCISGRNCHDGWCPYAKGFPHGDNPGNA